MVTFFELRTFTVRPGHHGANAARFFNYINLCLGNKLRSIRSKRMKNPICRSGNVSLGGYFDENDTGQVDDEFCHAHSAHLRGRCQRQERQRDARQALAEFAQFVQREDSSVIPAIRAILETGICRVRSRLRELGRCLMSQCRGNEDRIGDE
jgi:hypothetical protein